MFLIKDFVVSGIHLGHKTNKWNPKTACFLFGVRNNVHIIDLEQTILMLRRALNHIKKICEKRGFILYVPSLGATPSKNERIKLPQFLSSTSKIVRFGIQQNKDILDQGTKQSSNKTIEFSLMPKERKTQKIHSTKSKTQKSLLLREKVTGLRERREERLFIPEALFVTSVPQNEILIKEAIRLQLPVIAIVDSDSNPVGIDYPIPGNDDGIVAQNLYIRLILDAILEGKKLEIKKTLELGV